MWKWLLGNTPRSELQKTLYLQTEFKRISKNIYKRTLKAFSGDSIKQTYIKNITFPGEPEGPHRCSWNATLTYKKNWNYQEESFLRKLLEFGFEGMGGCFRILCPSKDWYQAKNMGWSLSKEVLNINVKK